MKNDEKINMLMIKKELNTCSVKSWSAKMAVKYGIKFVECFRIFKYYLSLRPNLTKHDELYLAPNQNWQKSGKRM